MHLLRETGKMKTGVVMVGVILMLIGGFFAVSLVIPSFSFGGMQSFTFLPIAGVIMGIVGFLTFLVGLAASESEIRRASHPIVRRRVTPQPATIVKTVAICPKCKNRISINSKFCPECGLDLRPKK